MLSLIFALLPWLFLSAPVFPSGQEMPEPENRIALSFSDSEGFTPSDKQLEMARSAGIRLLEISDPSRFAGRSAESFSILLNTPVYFPTSFELSENKHDLVQAITEHFYAAKQVFPEQIIAVNAFNFPAETKANFPMLAGSVADSVSGIFSVPLYFQSSYSRPPSRPGGFRFVSSYITPDDTGTELVTPVVHFYPTENPRKSLEALEDLFSKTSLFAESIIILPAVWFFDRVEQQPEIGYVISSYIRGNMIPFPLPAEPDYSPITNWSVILLFILWASFIIHFRYQPLYSYSVSRYFLSHSFFVKDVMEHRLRNSTPGLILYLQHALLTGLFVYVSSEVLVSEMGLTALSHHFSDLLVEGYELTSLFFLGVFTALVLQTISIIWIYMFNKKLRFFSQVFFLYCWPFHLNLIVVTFLVVFNLQGSADVWILTLSLIFGIIWFLSFNVAAIDSARFLEKRKLLNIFFTVGVHILLVSFVIWFVLNSPGILSPIDLAITLP